MVRVCNQTKRAECTIVGREKSVAEELEIRKSSSGSTTTSDTEYHYIANTNDDKYRLGLLFFDSWTQLDEVMTGQTMGKYGIFGAGGGV